MKFSVARGDLLESLTVVTKALSSRTTLPILAGILLTAGEDGVVLQSTDLEISIRDSVKANVEEQGSVVVPGRLLAEVTRSLPEAAVRVETSSFDQVTVKCEHSEFSLKTLSPDDFPRFPDIEEGTQVTLPVKTVLAMTKQVSKAVSRDESRPILTGVLLVMEDGAMRMVATDSYRLSVREESIESAPAEHIEAVIPGKALEEVPKMAAEDDEVRMSVSENQVVFEFGDTTYVTRRIEGSFPNYRQLIPQEGETVVKVDRAELVEAVKRVSLMAQHNAPLRLAVADNTLTLTAKTADVGEATENMMVEASGEPIEIAFNHAFLLDGISAADDETLEFVASSPLKPGVFRTPGSERSIYLIMPVRP